MRVPVFICICLCFIAESAAQIESARLYISYSTPLSKRLSVNEIDGMGGGLELSIRVTDFLSVSVSGGYELYSLNQDNALEQWNWRFWEQRYRGIVRADTAADPGLKASLNPVQKMDAIPLIINLKGVFRLAERFSVSPSAGAGVIFYTRRMYLHEYWEKRFTAADYTFEYDFRNFAQDKTGNPFLFSLGTELDYLLADYLSLSAAVKYIKIAATPGKYGYSEFPFDDELTIKAGLKFHY